MSGFLGRLVVFFTVCLISFIAYTVQIFVIWPWYGRVLSVELLQLLLPFNFLVGVLFYNYAQCVLVDPGRVPRGWVPDTNTDGFEVKKLSGRPRYCRACDAYKPPRSHHCRHCDRCVLRMDHHCPWINNCVGHFNYPFFLRFLFYVDVCCSYHLFMLVQRCRDSASRGDWTRISSNELIFIILNFVACVPVLLAVGGFSIYHFYCLMSNSTTIEGQEKDRVATLVRRGKIQEVKFPYHIGRLNNIKSVLGDNPLLWCCPLPAHGDGLSYRISDDAVNNGVTASSWPPEDPHEQPEGDFAGLPSSPWTYENGGFNPALRPTNAQLRRGDSSGSRRRRRAAVPPYHPNYQEGAPYVEDYSSSEESEEFQMRQPMMRRGSEGFEIRQMSREEMLQRYLAEQPPNRYNRYVPEPASESEEEA
ncbi:DHHC palmitoyltransferase-domain-containing protein [Schizophyllum commune]